jgi:uncharacterized protein with HEPN domain
MSKDASICIRDMLAAARKVRRYTRDLSFEAFCDNEMAVDAVLRNLEILGEAAKKVPGSTRQAIPGIEWRRIAGLRDVLIHDYANVSLEIGWDIVENKMPELTRQLRRILQSRDNQ